MIKKTIRTDLVKCIHQCDETQAPLTKIVFFGCNKRNRQQKTVRDGEPRTATSTFTQLLSSAEVEETTMVIKIPSSVDVEETTMIIKTPSCGRRRDNHDY